MTAPCWVLRHPDGEPWEPRDDGDTHYAEADALQYIQDLLNEKNDDGTPSTEAALAADLSAIQLPAPCLTLACPVCGREADSDEFPHLHFPTPADLDQWAKASGWRRVNGEWRCFDCPTHDDEDEEEDRTPGPADVPLPLEVSP